MNRFTPQGGLSEGDTVMVSRGPIVFHEAGTTRPDEKLGQVPLSSKLRKAVCLAHHSKIEIPIDPRPLPKGTLGTPLRLGGV